MLEAAVERVDCVRRDWEESVSVREPDESVRTARCGRVVMGLEVDRGARADGKPRWEGMEERPTLEPVVAAVLAESEWSEDDMGPPPSALPPAPRCPSTLR